MSVMIFKLSMAVDKLKLKTEIISVITIQVFRAGILFVVYPRALTSALTI